VQDAPVDRPRVDSAGGLTRGHELAQPVRRVPRRRRLGGDTHVRDPGEGARHEKDRAKRETDERCPETRRVHSANGTHRDPGWIPASSHRLEEELQTPRLRSLRRSLGTGARSLFFHLLPSQLLFPPHPVRDRKSRLIQNRPLAQCRAKRVRIGRHQQEWAFMHIVFRFEDIPERLA